MYLMSAGIARIALYIRMCVGIALYILTFAGVALYIYIYILNIFLCVCIYIYILISCDSGLWSFYLFYHISKWVINNALHTYS